MTQAGLDLVTLGRDDVGVVYCRIDGLAPPAPRPRATLVPTARWPELIARARRATAMKHLAALFRPSVYSAPRDHPVTIWKRRARVMLLDARYQAGFDGPLVKKGQPLEVLILRVRELAKSHHRKTSTIPRSWDTASGSGDWDNVGKPVCDAANGILWHDDCEIARAIVEEIVGAQGEPARLEIIARPLREIPERTRFEAERDQLATTGGTHGVSSHDPDQADPRGSPEEPDHGRAEDRHGGHQPVRAGPDRRAP
jgi:hypothetical protein